jgi:hypothetical protein
MYSLIMEQCNFKIKHLFKIFLVINTANDFTVLPIVRHSCAWETRAYKMRPL